MVEIEPCRCRTMSPIKSKIENRKEPLSIPFGNFLMNFLLLCSGTTTAPLPPRVSWPRTWPLSSPGPPHPNTTWGRGWVSRPSPSSPSSEASSTTSRGQSGRSSSQGRSCTRPRTTSKFPVKPYPPLQPTQYGTIEHLLHRKRKFHRDSVPSPNAWETIKKNQIRQKASSPKLSEKRSILPSALRIREKATSLFNNSTPLKVFCFVVLLRTLTSRQCLLYQNTDSLF